MIKYIRLYTLIVLLTVLNGCVNLTSVDNFKIQLLDNGGEKFAVYPSTWHTPNQLVETNIKSTGYIEYNYLHMQQKHCIYVLVVDADSQVILGTRIEGKESDCTLPP